METFEVGMNAFYIVTWLQTCVSQEVESDALNENDPYKNICFNAWSPFSGTLWKGLGVIVFERRSLSLGRLWVFKCHARTVSPLPAT